MLPTRCWLHCHELAPLQPSSLRAIEALLPIERIFDLPILSKGAGHFPDAFAHFSTLEDLTLVRLNPKDVSHTPGCRRRYSSPS